MTVLRPRLAGSTVDVRITVEPGTPLTGVHEELLAAAGAPAGHTWWHDGRRIDPASPLGLPPLLDGALLLATPDRQPGAEPRPPLLELHVLTGPAAGQVFPLAPGRHRIGRAVDQQVRLNDPDVSREHAELEVGPDGLRLRDLGSANGTTIAGRPVPPGTWAQAPPGTTLRLGSTELAAQEVTEPVAVCLPDGAGHLLVNRMPRPGVTPGLPSVTFPDPPAEPLPVRFSWTALLVPLLASIPMALFWHQPALLALALTGPLAVAAQYLVDRRRARRQGRRSGISHAAATEAAHRQLAAAVLSEAVRLDHTHPGLARTASVAGGPTARLWERQVAADGLTVRVGRGPVPSRLLVSGTPAPAPPVHPSAPVTVDLAQARVVGLCGPRPTVLGLARAMVGQLITFYSPRELELLLIVGDPLRARDWDWLRWAPHRLPDHRFADGAAPQARHRLVLLDAAAIARNLPAVARALDQADPQTSFFCLDDSRSRLPPECTVVVTVDAEPSQNEPEPGWTAATGTVQHRAAGSTSVLIDAAPHRWAATLARRLAPLREVSTELEHGLPTAVSWRSLMISSGLDPADPQDVLRGWARPGRPATVLGMQSGGPFTVDLQRDGPHLLVAGTTGAGKSELLTTLVVGLAVGNRPDELNLLLIDYKGGAAFSGCRQLPQVAGLVTDLDEHLARRALTSLTAEIRRRERLLGSAAAGNLDHYLELRLRQPDLPALPRLVIVVDEFRVLADELPGFLPGLVRIAAVGRSLGIHLVLATQRPAGAISADLRANVNLRIALRVRDRTESEDVVDVPTAADLDPSAPGRAVARSGAEPPVVFQTARLHGDPSSDGPSVTVLGPAVDRPRPRDAAAQPARSPQVDPPAAADDLACVVEAVREAARRCGASAAAAPWLPALPGRLTLADLDRLPISCPGEPCSPAGSADLTADLAEPCLLLGLADHPDRQYQHGWGWSPSTGGNLGITGGPRSGRTTAIRALVSAARGRPGTLPVPVYLIDGSGALAELAAEPAVGAVAPATDVERCERLLRRLDGLVQDRRQGQAGRPVDGSAAASPVLLLIDGWESVVEAWAPYDHAAAVEQVVRLMRDGPALGLFTAVTGGRSLVTGLPAAQLGQRLVLPLPDPGDEMIAGVPASMLGRRRVPGRGFWLGPGAKAGVEVQLALVSPGPATGRPPEPPTAQSATLPGGAVRSVASLRPAPRVRDQDPVPFRVPALPTHLTRDQLDQVADGIPFGVGGDQLDTLCLPLPVGSGVLIAGHPGSGRSTALATLADALGEQGTEHLLLDPWRPDAAELVAANPGSCVLVDGPLQPELEAILRQHLAAGPRSGGRLVLTCEPGQVVSAYTGLIADLRGRRTGLLLGALGPGDGEGFGLRLPPRPAGPAGRGLLVVRGRPVVIQVALPDRRARPWGDESITPGPVLEPPAARPGTTGRKAG